MLCSQSVFKEVMSWQRSVSMNKTLLSPSYSQHSPVTKCQYVYLVYKLLSVIHKLIQSTSGGCAIQMRLYRECLGSRSGYILFLLLLPAVIPVHCLVSSRGFKKFTWNNINTEGNVNFGFTVILSKYVSL